MKNKNLITLITCAFCLGGVFYIILDKMFLTPKQEISIENGVITFRNLDAMCLHIPKGKEISHSFVMIDITNYDERQNTIDQLENIFERNGHIVEKEVKEYATTLSVRDSSVDVSFWFDH